MPDPVPAIAVQANDMSRSPGGTRGIQGKRRTLLERTLFHLEQLKGDFDQMGTNEDGTGPKWAYLLDLDVRENSRAVNRLLDQLTVRLNDLRAGRITS